MKLTPEQVDRLINALDQRWPDPKICPICKNTTWDTLDIVFELKGYTQDPESNEQPTVMPLVPLTCKNCGNTILFNVIAAGILSSEG
jgi:hypothetical protein